MKYGLLILAAMICVGCGQPKPLYGTVTRKLYKPAWVETRITYVGKTISTETIHHPPEWDFVIQKEDTEGEDGRQLIRVTEGEYNRLDLGRVWYRKDTVIEQ